MRYTMVSKPGVPAFWVIGNVYYLQRPDALLDGPPKPRRKRTEPRRVRPTIDALKSRDHHVVSMYCAGRCGESWSTNPSDYWYLQPGHVFKCCGRMCALTVTGR